MKKVIPIVVALLLALGLAQPAAYAADNYPCTYTGYVFIDGAPAPFGTSVQVLEGNTVLGETTTGFWLGLDDNQFYLDGIMAVPRTTVTFEIYWDCGGGAKWIPAIESATHLQWGRVIQDLYIQCGATPIPMSTHIDANPLLFVYQGATCNLPKALTNIGPDGMDVAIMVWGMEEGKWISYDVAMGAGLLTELVYGKPYVMILAEGGVGNWWEMSD